MLLFEYLSHEPMKQTEKGVVEMKVQIRVYAILVAILLFFVLSPLSAWSGPRDHNDGFFLRLSGGGGSAKTSICFSDEDMEFSGASGDVNLAVGAIVTPNLALHGTLWGWTVSEPDWSWGEYKLESVPADVNISAFGGGLTYYFMPVNMYLSGSVGVGILGIDLGPLTGESDPGLTFDITLGKEWWVGDNWGLGVAGGFSYHSIPQPDPEIDENWTGTSFGIRFSATMN